MLSLLEIGCEIWWRFGEELVPKLAYLGEILFTKFVRLFCLEVARLICTFSGGFREVSLGRGLFLICGIFDLNSYF